MSDQEPRGVEDRVERALHARIAEVEDIERLRQRPEAEKRQDRQHEHGPGRGQRALEPARRFGAGIAIDDPARAPVDRDRGQRAAGARSRPMPSACVVVRRLLRPENQSPRTVDIARASAGISRDTLGHNCGLNTEEERAKVWRANRSRRLAPIRVALSSALSSRARAVRRLASSASCFCFSLASSVAAASVAVTARRPCLWSWASARPDASPMPRGAA